MVTTSRQDWADRARRLREHAMSVSAADRHASVLAPADLHRGGLQLPDDRPAGRGRIVQLGRLPEIVARRREIAAAYAEQRPGRFQD